MELAASTRFKRWCVLAGIGLSLAGALGAHAAEPSAPDRLPAEAQGVVGSGDQLSLKLKDGRTIAVGQAYAEDWILTGLTPTKAVLAKDGAIREVGLNPTGALADAGASAPPSTVTVAGSVDEAAIELLVAARAARTGSRVEITTGKNFLTEAETRRIDAYAELIQENSESVQAFAKAHEAELRAGTVKLPSVNQRDVMGEAAYADFWALQNKIGNASVAARLADLAVNPRTGPDRIPLPAGTSESQVLQVVRAAGGDMRGDWRPEQDPQGGQVMVWQQPRPVQRPALPPPLPSKPAGAGT